MTSFKVLLGRIAHALEGIHAELIRLNDSRDEWAREVVGVLRDAKTPKESP